MWKRKVLPVLLIASAGGFGVFVATATESKTQVIFMSVGQGDCTVFASEGVAVLVDTGPANRDYDAGTRIVLPKLREYGITHVSMILLTHPDADHIGGTGALLRAFPGAKVAINSSFRQDKGLSENFRKWGLKETEVHWMVGHEQLRLGQFAFDLWLPSKPADAPTNDGSMFAYVVSGTTSMVLTGDAPEQVEIEMQRCRKWEATIMKAGHHGSKSSTGEFWLQSVQPQTVIISCGRDNSYGHPAKTVLNRLEKFKVQTLRTDVAGDIVFQLRDGRLIRQ